MDSSIDTMSSPQFYQCKYGRVRLLSVDNYPDWSTSLTNFLKADRTWKIVRGIESAPTAPAQQTGSSRTRGRPEPQDEAELTAARDSYEEKLEDYESRSAKACSMILSSVSSSFQQFIYAMTDPTQMWTTLKTQLDSMNANAGPYILRAQFFQEKHSTGPISAFFAKLMQYQTRLSSTDFKIQDIDLISHILSYGTLPPRFDSTIEVLRLQPSSNWSALTQILINKEIQMNTLSEKPNITTTSAMVSNSRNQRNQNQNQRKKYSKKRSYGSRNDDLDESDSDNVRKSSSKSKNKDSSIQCYYCCKYGHKATDCKLREQAKKIRKSNSKKTSKDEAAVNAAIASTQAANEATIADAEIWACYTTIPTTSDQDPIFQKAWHLDSGATDHICNNKKAFLKIQRLPKPIQVRIGDNSIVPAAGIGTVLLTALKSQQIQLTDVLYVPAIGTNLLSVSKLTDKGCEVQFSKNGQATILNQKDRSIATAYRKNGMYQVRVSTCFLARKSTPKVQERRPKPFPIELWHQRLGHLNFSDIRKLTGIATGIRICPEINNQDRRFCVSCLEGKMDCQYNKQASLRASKKLELIHSDLCGPFPTNSVSGSRYFIIFVDDATRFTWVYFLRTKSSEEVLRVFEQFKALVEKEADASIRRFQCDNGTGEYSNRLFTDFLLTDGISFQPSAPYTQNQNGVSERAIRTIVEKARTMLLNARLSEGFWEEAVRTAVYLKNRSPTKAVDLITPSEAWTGQRPELNHLRPFGCDSYAFIHPDLRTKWNPKVKSCTFLGYIENTTAQYRVWNGHRIVVVSASNLRFNEQSFKNRDSKLDLKPIDWAELRYFPVQQDVLEERTEDLPSTNQPLASGTVSTTVEPPLRISELPLQTTEPTPPIETHLQVRIRRSTREKRPSFKLRSAFSARIQALIEPISYREAIKHPYSKQWNKAMKEECEALDYNKTWDLVDEDTTLTSGKKVIGCKWVYKLKRNADGSRRFKARLVIRGFEQEYGIDFTETFAPVAKFVTVRMLFALAAKYDWEIEQMDVVTAFLNPQLQEEVFMELPEGYPVPDSHIFPRTSGGRLICRLRKCLYGLKQAPRAWYTDIDIYLNSIGFTRSNKDYNLYISKYTILLLFVDDILLFSPNVEAIRSVKDLLRTKYRMLDLGPVQQFLGIQVVRNRHTRSIHINQAPYIETILKRFQMDNCNGVSTPMDPNLQLEAALPSYIASRDHLLEYQQAVGSIMYAMLGTRPDLAFTVSTLSKYCSNPGPTHAIAVQRALRYLRKTATIGITYKGQENPAVTDATAGYKSITTGITGFTDSDWAGDKDTRKSTSGYIFLLYGGAVSWKSTKQSVVATSSTEAEYIACSDAAKEALWIRRLDSEIKGTAIPVIQDRYQHETNVQDYLQTLQIIKPTATTPYRHPQIILADNQGAIKLSKNPQYHNRTKHIDVRYHFIRKSCQDGLIELAYIPTSEMVADILTKALPRDKHEKHMKGMGMD